MNRIPHIQIDEQVINDRLEDIHHATQELEQFQSMDIETFRTNEDAVSVASRCLYESLESIVAVETYLLECLAQQETSQNDKQDKKQTNNQKTPAVSLLVERGILPKDLSQRLKGIKRYRDRMKHEYWKIQPEELLRMTQKGLPDFKEFEKQIRNSFSLGSNSFLTNASLLSLLLAVTIIGSFFFLREDPEKAEAALTVNSPTPNNNSITDGLVGHWTFDGPDIDWGSTGTEIKDRSGNGNDGDASTSGMDETNATEGKIGQGWSFDGSSDYIKITDSGTGSDVDFGDGDSITITEWIYPMDTTTEGILISKDTTASCGYETNYKIGFLPGGALKFEYRGTTPSNNNFYTVSPDVVSQSEWQLIAFVYTFGTGSSAKFYKNGEILSSGYWYTGGDDSPMQSDQPVWIGAENYCGGSSIDDAFSGYVDDLRIYKRILSTEEIQNIYRIGQ